MFTGVPFAEFLAPGLVMMAIAQNSFANTSSSLMIAKVQGQHRRYTHAAVHPDRTGVGHRHGRRDPGRVGRFRRCRW